MEESKEIKKIRLLDKDTINKISAGEVVERPVSVVKELIENAIDAGADAITVEIKDGGISLIRVTDNGCGIDKQDLETAFFRHATSKIKTAQDLEKIVSLGFRGEALASISAVAQVECITKIESDTTGLRYLIEGGTTLAKEEIGCPGGTTFVIRNLFFNVPARKKFLKSDRTEGSYVTELIHKMALSHPGISFKYLVNGAVKLHTSGNYQLKDGIYQIFGKQYATQLRPVNYQEQEQGIEITGYVGEPSLSRGNRQNEIYFVNGRFIKSKWISQGIEQAMEGILMVNQYPFCVLFLQIDSQKVDVNVHPNKMEVRFDNEELIKRSFHQAVAEALSHRQKIMNMQLDQKQQQAESKLEQKQLSDQRQNAPEPFEKKRRTEQLGNLERQPISQAWLKSEIAGQADLAAEQPQADNQKLQNELNLQATKREMAASPADGIKTDAYLSQEVEVQTQLAVNETAPFFDDQDKRATGSLPSNVETNDSLDHFLDREQVKKHRILGQAFKTYWVVESGAELYLIDQHAAHEKVLYEEWIKKIDKGAVPSQILLEPQLYQLSDREMETFRQFRSNFIEMGFDVAEFGENTIVIKSVPYLLNRPLTNLDFIHIFDQLMVGKDKTTTAKYYNDKIATVACKAAIKGNNRISEQEYRGLVEQLLELENPYNCPHGRPTMIRLSKYELEKGFKRIV